MSTWEDTKREDVPAPAGTELCSRCRKRKPVAEFFVDKRNANRHFTTYECKECRRVYQQDMRRDKRLPALVGSGVTIRAGNGVVEQSSTKLVAPPGYVSVVETVQVEAELRDTMTMAEWMTLAQVPSVFASGRMALLLHSAGDTAVIELLTTSGDGPHEALTQTMAFYLVRLLAKKEADSLVGVVYY